MIKVDNLESRKGFTLVELLFVIVIVGILSSLAVSSVINWVHRVKVRNFAEETLSDLEWARVLAFKKGSSKVEFQNDKYLIYVTSDSSTPIKEKVAPEGVTIITNLTSGEVEFRRNKLPDRAGSIKISGFGVEYKIVINHISGRIYLEKT